MARPPRIEKLQHGKLLCGSVFRFFVETWNWLVGYVDNMKGDADVNPQGGHITIDRTDPDHPVVRFRADKAAGGAHGGDAALPWSFACTIKEGGEGEEETRTGGWFNCRTQIGFDIWGSPDTDCSHLILGTDQRDDGDYYLEVVLANNTEGRESDAAEIKLAADMDSTASDYIGGIIRIFIGTVEDGKLTDAPHFNPVVYKYV